MKVNTATTKLQRLRIVIGVLMIVIGFCLISFIIPFYNSADILWVVSLGLIIGGFLISLSKTVLQLIGSFLHMFTP